MATITLPAADILKLEAGKAACISVGKTALIALKKADGSLLVAPNTCMVPGNDIKPCRAHI